VDITTIVYSGTTATLQDATSLLDDNDARIPLDWIETKITLYNFLVLFHGLIGHAHPLVLEMHRLMWMFGAFKLRLGCLQTPAHVSYLDLPTLVVRWVQVRVASWLCRQYEAPGLADIPDLGKLFTCGIEMNDPSWIPLMLTCLLPSIQLGICPTATQTPFSMVSGVMATSTLTPLTALNPTATTVGIQINNPTHDVAFDLFCTKASARAQAVCQNAIKLNVPIPTWADGHPICLAYHVKGMCNMNCAQSHDHMARPAGDNKALLAWCHTHWK